MYLHTNLMWGSSHGWKREVHWRWAVNRPRPVRGASVCRRGPEINRHGTPLLPWSLVWRPSASQGLRPFLAPIILRFTPIQGVNKLTSTKCLLMNFRKLLHMHTLNKILKELQKPVAYVNWELLEYTWQTEVPFWKCKYIKSTSTVFWTMTSCSLVEWPKFQRGLLQPWSGQRVKCT